MTQVTVKFLHLSDMLMSENHEKRDRDRNRSSGAGRGQVIMCYAEAAEGEEAAEAPLLDGGVPGSEALLPLGSDQRQVPQARGARLSNSDRTLRNSNKRHEGITKRPTSFRY